MKGYAVAPPPWKRRWRRPTAKVVSLVFFSLLVSIAFLLGFHNHISSGFLADDRFPLETSFANNARVDSVQESFEGAHLRIDKIVKKFGVSPGKDIIEKEVMKSFDSTVNTERSKHVPSLHKNDSQFHLKRVISPINYQFHLKSVLSPFKPKDFVSSSNAMSTPQIFKAELPPSINSNYVFQTFQQSDGQIWKSSAEMPVGGAKKLCHLEFGSYCLWSTEHKVTMKDSMVKKLKDQLFIARAYYPSIAKLKSQQYLTHELKQNIQDHEKILSDAISDVDLPSFVTKKIQKMDETIGKAKQCSIDCTNVDKKLRQILDSTEDEVHFHMKQSAFLYNLGVQTMPKSLHCFFLRLTVEYFRSASTNRELHIEKKWNPSFRHFVVFSVNVLAASVTVNSTVMNSEITENMVFHIITDKLNYYAMKYWFARYSFKEASIHVINFDKLKKSHSHNLVPPQFSPSEEFHISMHDLNRSTLQMKTEYMSVFGHSHFLLPEIFKNLKKVVILDDDVVVQKDLSFLWKLDMGEKVVGAVEFCGVVFDQLKGYFARNKYDPNSCVWMSGLNIVDLDKWREHNVTGIYNKLLWEMKNTNESSWRTAILPATLLTFRNLIYPLHSSWTLSGLGYNYRINDSNLNGAAALHYNGKMKPWLELGIPRYKSRWKKFLKKGDLFMNDCNVNL